MKWELKLLSEITTNLDGRRIPLNNQERESKRGNGTYPYLGANNIVDWIDEYIFDEKILCVAEDGGNWGANQKCASIFKGRCWVNNHTHVLVENGASLEYIAYYLNQADLTKWITGTTRGKLTQKALNSIPIPLPPLPTQRRIAAILDKADALVQNDRLMLRKYDDLAQSVFLEMFGDPVKNEKGWEVKRLADCCESDNAIICGPFGTQLHQKEFREQGVPLWGIKQVNRHFSEPTHEFISEQKAIELQRYNILPGDIVMTRKGTIGNCAIYPSNFPMGIMHSDLLRIRLNRESIENDYMVCQLRYSNDVKIQIEKISHGAIMAGINVTKLKNINVQVPPLRLQHQFTASLQHIHHQKSLTQTSLAKSEALFQSLLQRAFRGELVE